MTIIYVLLTICRYTIINATVNLTTFLIAADSAPRFAPATFFGLAAGGAKFGGMIGFFL